MLTWKSFAFWVSPASSLSVSPAQLPGVEEYINRISAERLAPTPNQCPVHDIKQSDGEAPALGIWGM